MGKLTQYAVNALMKVPHPEIERRQCWNLHPHRTPCTACKDVCPMSEEILYPAQPGKGLGCLHQLRPVRLGLPQPVHCTFAGAGAGGCRSGRHR